ncbi:MAG TPA: SAM-dependent chlorinase/fluorinase [Candidatus Limnocylindrales bacterium]|nr:SAM-dependent chlorinase/fluorinase [Candidatus Limnocylindrales bacterium]
MARPVITFVTDFGPAAPAVCRGVMFGIAPDANIIDINHQVPRYSIRDGAGTLVFALPHMPIGVHVAVVDPGVGTQRLPIGLRVARGDILIGPDNGLLVPAAEKLGGVVEARALENPKLMLPKVTTSFHGRDIFAPMAAHLAMGVPFEQVGPTVDPGRLTRFAFPTATVREGRLETVVTNVLIFGNLTFAGSPADLENAIGPLAVGRRLVVDFAAHDGRPAVREQTTWATTFGDVPLGASLLMEDSEGNLSLADNQGDAAGRLGLAVDRPATIGAA